MRNQRRSPLFLVCIMLAMSGVLLLGACAPIVAPPSDATTGDEQPISLKIGYAGWVGEGPLFIARDLGYFQEEGLTVEAILFADPKSRFAALADQHLDGLLAAMAPMTLYWQADRPFAAILAIDEAVGADGILVRKDAHIASVNDLKGKRIGVNLRSIAHFFLDTVLQQHGLSESDVTLVQMLPADVPAALSAGQLQAGVTWEPHLSKATADENLTILLTSKDLPGLEVDALIVRKDILARNQEIGGKLVRAWEKAVAYQQANPDEAAAVIQQELSQFYQTPAAVLADMQYDVLYDQARNVQFFSGDGPGTALGTTQAAIDFWTQQGQITTTVKAEDMLDGSYLQQ
jgi:NitT/TauT family transport system substrate-binding protein